MKPLAQPLSYGDGMDPPDCPAGPDCSCCGDGTRASLPLPPQAPPLDRDRPLSWWTNPTFPCGLDEVCGERRSCNGTPTESCCGTARCADCHREHRTDDCGELADEVRGALFGGDGCDHTFSRAICLACAERVDAEVRVRAERGE